MGQESITARVTNIAPCTTYENGKQPYEWYVVQLRLGGNDYYIDTHRKLEVGQEVTVRVMLKNEHGTPTSVCLADD